MNEAVVIRIKKELKEKLNKAAKKDRRSVSAYVRNLIEDKVNGT